MAEREGPRRGRRVTDIVMKASSCHLSSSTSPDRRPAASRPTAAARHPFPRFRRHPLKPRARLRLGPSACHVQVRRTSEVLSNNTTNRSIFCFDLVDLIEYSNRVFSGVGFREVVEVRRSFFNFHRIHILS